MSIYQDNRTKQEKIQGSPSQLLFTKNKAVKREESEATAMDESTTGAKLTNLGTVKPVTKPLNDNEKKTNENFEGLEKQIRSLNEGLKLLIDIEKRKYPDYIKTLKLTSTSQARIQFGIDTNNTPISKIRVISVGAGLFISLNGDDYFTATAGDTYEAEIRNIDYYVTGGNAFIQIYARIDK